MKVIKYLCDKCGKEMEDKNEVYKLEITKGLTISALPETVHLCKECNKALLKWINYGTKQ